MTRRPACGLLLLLIVGPAVADDPSQSPVFTAGEGGYHTYRIPSLITTSKGTLLAFCEARKKGRGDAGDIDLVLRRSLDGGKTWQPMQVVWDDGANTCGNPCPVIDDASGTIWLLLTHNLGTDTEAKLVDGTSKGTRTVWISKNTDDGVTWAKPIEITKDVKKPEWTWYATGPGVGIQTKTGRLVIPCDNKVAGTKAHQSHVIYSDDRGITWKLGGEVGPNCNESQVAERDDGSLILNMRSFQANNRRFIATSTDGGLTWSKPVADPALIEPVCQASLIRYSGNDHYFSNPASTKREKLTVRLSRDGGRTWPSAKVLHDGPAAYSCLAVMPGGDLGCLYERGEKSPYETITFARFSPTWVTGETPTKFEWQTATPESQGMSSARLDALRNELAKRQTKAFLVIRNDRIVHEWYAPEHGVNKTHYTASLAKAIVAGMSLAVAITNKQLALDDLAEKFVPQWMGDSRKSKITIRHLGSHTSGLDDAEEDGKPHENLTGWKGDFWKRLPPPNDPFTISRDRTPVLFDPGERLRYSNPGIAMLTYCVTNATRTDSRTLLRHHVMEPIGVPDAAWSVGYGKTDRVDGHSLVGSWGGGSFTARATARVGRLVLRGGDWDGKQLLSKDSIRQVTTCAGLPGECGMGWWTNAAGRYSYLPKDAVWGAGAGDQVLLVVPSLNLIMVRSGGTLEPSPKRPGPEAKPPDVFAAFHDPRAKVLFEPLIAAITERAPYPPSPVITGITWAPKESIMRRAKGSDNWPLTWADDGHQYTAYGDGNGFEPFLDKKLSLGLARIEGPPSDFKGINLRAPTLEQLGDGAKGKKASGILMVGGTLYLWARNAGNSRLAWSKDRGATWEWADWTFTTSFGCPTFLNFGRSYAGARDDFVYVYSHDHASAYEPADRMVMARVPKDKIGDRGAYEFFRAIDTSGQPEWTRSIEDRGAVFEHAGRCYRSGISYNTALKRYLWVQILAGTQGKKPDTRFEGGFGIYDAPEPWGPWTTAYFTEKWDVGPGESASFPTKWMSADGKTLHLVFSGDDTFAVRRATLEVVSPRPDR